MPKFIVIRKFSYPRGPAMQSEHVVHECETPEEVNEILTSRQYSEWAPKGDEFTVTQPIDWPSPGEAT